jgi:hypothetical protein
MFWSQIWIGFPLKSQFHALNFASKQCIFCIFMYIIICWESDVLLVNISLLLFNYVIISHLVYAYYFHMSFLHNSIGYHRNSACYKILLLFFMIRVLDLIKPIFVHVIDKTWKCELRNQLDARSSCDLKALHCVLRMRYRALRAADRNWAPTSI